MITRTIMTLVAASFSGAVFYGLKFPLPWLLGPMAGMIIWNVFLAAAPLWPVKLRNAGLVFIGYMMGSTFTPDAARQIAAQYPEMMMVTLLTIAFSMALGYITYRQSGISLASSVIGSVPGGLSQMSVLGEEIPAADGSVVAFMQTIRVVGVLFCVPFVALHGLAGEAVLPPAQAWAALGQPINPASVMAFGAVVIAGTIIAVMLKFPTPYLLGPVLSTCLLTITGLPAAPLPGPDNYNFSTGGGDLYRRRVRLGALADDWRKMVPYTVLSVAAILFFSFALGWLLSRYTATNLVTGFLSAAPGGMAEMGLTAMMVSADVSSVVAFQLFRVLFILLILPLILKRWLGGGQEEKDEAADK